LLLLGCRDRLPAARLPTAKEAGPESVVVNYGPRLLRVFPTPPAGAPPDAAARGYLILASERPELPAIFRPLAVTAQKPPQGQLARAGELAWVAGHAVAAAPWDETAGKRPGPRFIVYDSDAKVGTPVDVALPAPCFLRRPAMLTSDGGRLHALVSCADSAQLLLLDDKAQLVAARPLKGTADA